jgi:hypothetical protein
VAQCVVGLEPRSSTKLLARWKRIALDVEQCRALGRQRGAGSPVVMPAQEQVRGRAAAVPLRVIAMTAGLAAQQQDRSV